MARVEDGIKWASMQSDWQAVNQEACKAEARVMQAFAKFAVKGRACPRLGQLEFAERLEQAADEKRLAMDEFVQRAFG